MDRAIEQLTDALVTIARLQAKYRARPDVQGRLLTAGASIADALELVQAARISAAQPPLPEPARG